MQVNNLLSNGLQGFQQATERANQAAANIASQSVTNSAEQSIDQPDLITSLVELTQAEIDAKANAKVIETASTMVGSLLDITV